ncbi:hypothetical protein CspeluHIS016_0109570 [Cutaneotrichosporon spelunceum]|uniref:STB6-like N-terminal domain-containing protein n=1 Tax=Cutaneotrichosporon spelunceum TaxID=1672016 RepID=A0AAD3TNZ6_9TREE|nr:hypothetical protein CspeluHIS016_0109570 [Cutaneotrichosporon spelunceum]
MVTSAPATSPGRTRFGSPTSPTTASPPLSTSPGSPARQRDVPPIANRGLGLRHLSASPSPASGSGKAVVLATRPSRTLLASQASPATPLAIKAAPTTSALATQPASTTSALTLQAAPPTSRPSPTASLASQSTSVTPSQSTTITHRRHVSDPTWDGSHPGGLLVPTDRPLDEFEAQWLPRLGRLRVDREVVLHGYALYGIRSWYLSRTHWALTIAAYTAKPTDVVSLSDEIGAEELRAATHMLAAETQAKPRNTAEGTLLVSVPTVHGQEVWPIPQGDVREAWPFIVLNTALRRLGCGGRAVMGNETPVAAVRRKFYESYRISVPGGALAQGNASRTASPPQSPVRTHSRSHSLAFEHQHKRSVNLTANDVSAASGPSSEDNHVVTPTPLEHDPLMLSSVELVKLIQGGLALWGFYGTKHEEIELDGRFCDETKAGVAMWRTAMGMEQEDSLKIEKETSGGCIDPRTLAVLLSSVTSARYQLGTLNVERLPKDPFHSVRRFLSAWRSYQTSMNPGKPAFPFLSVQAIRHLNSCYVGGRKSHASDAFKVHRLLISGVGSVASGVQSVVKGGATNDDNLPARKREQHIRYTGREEDSGVSMIVRSDGSATAPDVITSDLDAYVKGVLKSREKDWDIMGARRIAVLWSGRVAEIDGSRGHSRLRVFSRRSNQGVADEEDDTSLHLGTAAIGTIRGAATGAIKGITKGGLRVVGRRPLPYDTSDSESGKHALSPAQSYARRNVPTVVEPDDVDDHRSERTNSFSAAPPTPLVMGPVAPSPAVPSPSLAQQSMRFHNSDSDAGGGWDLGPDLNTRRRTVAAIAPVVPSKPATQSPERARRGALARTASDGADIITAPNGLHWTVANGRGSGKRIDESVDTESADAPLEPQGVVRGKVLRRSQSLQADRRVYRSRHVNDPTHLSIDVAMCEVVWELRRRERMLAKRADDMSVLERSAFAATQAIFDTARQRRERIEELEREVDRLRDQLSHASDAAVLQDRALKWANEKITYKKSGDVNTAELHWQLRQLENHYEAMRAERDARKAARDTRKARSWWWPWGS